jgi:hypothetical protein
MSRRVPRSLGGWPAGKFDPLTPAGEAEQIDKLLSGLARQKGGRRLAAKIAAAAVLLLIAAFVALQVSHLV